MSLVELLVVIAVIGVIAAVAIPAIQNINESSKQATAIANAKNVAQMSSALSSLGVAHVIPDSMGGVEATARLLREGVVVTEGPLTGERMSLDALGDEAISDLAEYLDIQYGKTELMLVFKPQQKFDTIRFLRDVSSMMAFLEPKPYTGS